MSIDCDHRLIGQRQDLFHLQEEAPGAVFWHPRGWALLRILESHVRRLTEREGFREVRTPQVFAESVWRASGHLEHFSAGMFGMELDRRRWALKPASCPGHIQIALRAGLSWRDLPYRLSEFGLVHRNEPSGAVQGLLRLRQFTQDDGHIFCRPDQVGEEVARFCGSLRRFYSQLGFEQIAVGFSTRPDRRAGTEADWDRAEQTLQEAAASAGIALSVQPGQGAFYGPKLEFSLRDRLHRAWQCGTIQLDLAMAERFGLEYVERGGERRPPTLLHRAVFGSLERFLGILLEHHGGSLPAWLSPEQIVVAPIQAAQIGFAQQVAGGFRDAGLRVIIDARAESLAKRVRDAHALAIPFVVAVGAKEEAEHTLSIRGREVNSIQRPLEQGTRWLADACRPPGDRGGDAGG